MQSPIDVDAPNKEESGRTDKKFSIDYKFEKNVGVEVGLNGVEIVVKFLDYAGAFKINYGKVGKMLSFTPKWMSFRFPAEHLINSFRFDGELVIVLNEVTPRNNEAISITNGMEFVIPIQFNPKSPEYPEIDKLTPDNWRKEIKGRENKTYRPRDITTGKFETFDLQSFIGKIFALKSDFSLYMGSATTPPCKGKIFNFSIRPCFTACFK